MRQVALVAIAGSRDLFFARHWLLLQDSIYLSNLSEQRERLAKPTYHRQSVFAQLGG